MYLSTVTLPMISLPLLAPPLVISATHAVAAALDTSVRLPFVVRTALLVPKLSMPVSFNISLTLPKLTPLLLLIFRFLMVLPTNMLPEMD